MYVSPDIAARNMILTYNLSSGGVPMSVGLARTILIISAPTFKIPASTGRGWPTMTTGASMALTSMGLSPRMTVVDLDDR